MINYELMNIWRTTHDSNGDIIHDSEGELPGYDSGDMTDTESVMVGSPMDIVKYILKHDLQQYKLLKK